jgi:hypothetical protein
MHWLLQENLSTPEQLVPYISGLNAIKKIGATWSFIKLIPFSGEVIPADDYNGKKVFALGSTSLVLAAQKYGWKPGVIYNENFRYEAWLKGWGKENLLNGDGVISRFANARIDGKAFIRPCEDLKAFTGFVIDEDYLTKWQFSINEGEKSTRSLQLTNDTMVVVAPPKLVLREWRFFVVNGKVISGSQYRTAYSKNETADVDADVYAYAQNMADTWNPAPCFAIDIASTEGGDRLSIVEMNCFNGSGVYLCDMARVFSAVEIFYNCLE